MRGQLGAADQHGSGLIDSLIDALVAQPHSRVVREPAPQVSADLLRTPPLRQELADHAPQLSVLLDTPPVLAGPTRDRATVSLERAVPAVPAAGGVAAQLAGDRRGRPGKPLGYLPDAHPALMQVGDLDPLVLG